MSIITNNNYFICPISKQIFKDPVLAEDGVFYERELIKCWFKDHGTSPITNLEINKNLTTSYLLNEMLANFLKNNPLEYKNQYGFIKTHLDYLDKVNTYIINGNFKKLFKYANFSSVHIGSHLEKILKNCKNNDILKHIISNLDDLEHIYNTGWRLIHYVSRYSDFDIILFLIDKKVDLQCETIDGTCRPVHIICAYQQYSVIKYFLSLPINIHFELKKIKNDILLTFNISDMIQNNSNLDSNEKNKLLENIKNK